MVFDEPNLVSHAGLMPALGLATGAGLIELTDRRLTVPGGAGHAAINHLDTITPDAIEAAREVLVVRT